MNPFYLLRKHFPMKKKIFYFLLKLMPTKRKTIYFKGFNGASYGCNLKYIANEIIRQKLPYTLYWEIASTEKAVDFPKEIKLLKSNSLISRYFFSRANVIIANLRIGKYFKEGPVKKQNQLYIQTWHSSLRIKKIEADAEHLPESYIKNAKFDSQNIDILLSGSKWTSSSFKKCFFYDGTIEEIGMPRNDIFFKNDENLKRKVKKSLGIDENVRVLFYAPTFRDNIDFTCYTLDYKRLKETLEKEYSGKWQIVIRLHPNLLKYIDKLGNIQDVVDATNYCDIQELLLISDMMISDYSSCIFDFMLQLKPAFIFATDIERYNTDRGFYYPLESTPFPIATTNDMLLQNIKNLDLEEYKSKAKLFIEDKGIFFEGDSSYKCVELIKKHIKTY